MLKQIQQLGANTLGTLQGLGRATLMLFGALWGRPRPLKNWHLYMKQIYVVGVLSLLIILVSGLFIGMVLALQGYTVSGEVWCRTDVRAFGGIESVARAGAGRDCIVVCRSGRQCADRRDWSDESH